LSMDQRHQVYHLRAYAQTDPITEYQVDGFAMLESMIEAIEKDGAKYVMKAEIVNNLKREEVAKGTAVIPSSDGSTKQKRQPIRRKINVGRNDPCPCGSGKKFKHCHGQNAS